MEPSLNSLEASKPAHNNVSQFDIVDLFLATAGFALAVGLMGIRSNVDNASIPIIPLIYSVYFGVSTAGFFVLLRRLRKNADAVLNEPGCWLLLHLGVEAVMYSLHTALERLWWEEGPIVLSEPGTPEVVFYVVVQTITNLTNITLLVFGAYRVSRIWKLCFIFLIVSNVLLIFDAFVSLFTWNEVAWLYYLCRASAWLALAFYVVGALRDRLKKLPYGWLHWLGIILFVFRDCLLPIVNSVLVQFFSWQELYGGNDWQ